MDFIVPQIPKWGTPEWVKYLAAVDRGVAAIRAAEKQRVREEVELERLYNLPESK